MIFRVFPHKSWESTPIAFGQRIEITAQRTITAHGDFISKNSIYFVNVKQIIPRGNDKSPDLETILINLVLHGISQFGGNQERNSLI